MQESLRVSLSSVCKWCTAVYSSISPEPVSFVYIHTYTVMQERSVHVFVKASYFLGKLVHCRHSAVCSSVVQSQCTCPYVNYTTCAVTNVCTVYIDLCRTVCACCYQNMHVDVNRMQDKEFISLV